MRYYKYGMIILVTVFLSACTSEDTVEHEDHSIAVTQWTDRMELFMEYPEPEIGEAGDYIIHLTTLDDFKPVTSGKVVLDFKPSSGQSIRVEDAQIAREGIFIPSVTFSSEGIYDFTLTYSSTELTEIFEIGDVIVSAERNEKELHKTESDGSNGIEIAFLKEQQWKTKFATSEPEIKNIRLSFAVVGEVLPNQRGYAEIVSPVDGIISVEHNQDMVIPGSRVSKGDALVSICPTMNGQNSWTELQLNYEKSKTDFERAERLLSKDAISQREYGEIKNKYLTNKAGYETFLGATANIPSKDDLECGHLGLSAPIAGTVTQVIAVPGQNVKTGDKMMTILDPDVIWIRMNIYEKDYYKIGESEGAEVKLPGIDESVYLDKNNWTVLSRGEIVDPQSRTIPFLVEVKNPDRIFKVGQSLQLNLYTSSQKEVLSVPAAALFDEDVQKIIYVQTGGEMFEKRIVETGAVYKGWVEIISGLNPGERVVTEGGYMVKLAENNTDIGHPHVH